MNACLPDPAREICIASAIDVDVPALEPLERGVICLSDSIPYQRRFDDHFHRDWQEADFASLAIVLLQTL